MEKDNLQAVITAARQGAVPTELKTFGAKSYWFLPGAGEDQGRIVDIDGEDYLAAPTRKRGTVTVFDAASFNQVIADNDDAGTVAIYVNRDPERPSIVAVLNGNGPKGPGFGDFRCNLEFRWTAQWKKWKGIDGKLIPQADFAEFVEDNMLDIHTPSGAQMLEIVTYLQATRTVAFKSGLRLSSGEIQFQNIENVDAKVGPGSIAVPEEFTLGIAPIIGLDSYFVPARFRFRLNDGKLTLGIKLQRVETLMEKILKDVMEKIEKGTTDGVAVFDGLPPSAHR